MLLLSIGRHWSSDARVMREWCEAIAKIMHQPTHSPKLLSSIPHYPPPAPPPPQGSRWVQQWKRAHARSSHCNYRARYIFSPLFPMRGDWRTQCWGFHHFTNFLAIYYCIVHYPTKIPLCIPYGYCYDWREVNNLRAFQLFEAIIWFQIKLLIIKMVIKFRRI